MYEKIFEQLKKKGIEFERGLSKEEICEIEEMYDLQFTNEWKEIYSILLPVSRGFYNWRNKNAENVVKIREAINSPISYILEEIWDVEWSEEWGKEPEIQSEREAAIKERIEKAPKLIPIYDHRYLASVDKEPNPIFSISGLDIIYYGENLISYYEIEFGMKKRSEMQYKNILPVEFWSDLL